MNIFVSNGSTRHRNIGDAAMLGTAMRRLRFFWNDARIVSPSFDPTLFTELFAGSIPTRGSRLWKLRRLLPGAPSRFKNGIRSSNLLVVAGGGFMADVFATVAHFIMDDICEAHRNGIPVVMCGQAVGPAREEMLVKRLRAVLPLVDLIGVREGLLSPGRLRDLGVRPDRVRVTGDDAIESGMLAGIALQGDRLGVSIRVASYSGIDRSKAASLQKEILSVLENLKAVAEPLAVRFGGDADGPFLEPLTGARVGVPDLDDTISRVGRCRAVIAGSYHAAVFALSRGVPVIALYRTPYYRDKFAGLQHQFPGGVELVDLSSSGWREGLKASVSMQWQLGESVRGNLFEAARSQVTAGRGFYEEIRELVGKSHGR